MMLTTLYWCFWWLREEKSALEQHPENVVGLVEMVEDNLINFINYLKHPT